MKVLKTETFSIRVPELFDEERIFCETIRVECNSSGHSLQTPEVNLLLMKQVDFADYQGETLFDRVCSSVTDFGETVVVLERTNLPIGELSGILQEGRDHWAWSERSALVQILLGGCMIDDQHILILKAFCETDRWEEFRPHILAIWQSVQIFGDPALGLQTQQETLDKLYPSRVEEDEPEPEIPEFEIPEDGEDKFCLDGCSLSFDESTQVAITDFDGSLSVKLTAHLEQTIPNREKLIDEYQTDGIVGFRMTFTGIHQRGTPTGSFDFKFGKSEDRDCYLWDDGWEYSLEFSGRVELRDGWLGMNGFLSAEFDEGSGFGLNLAKKIDLAKLDWSLYKFKGLEEIEGVEATLVSDLEIINPKFETLPPSVYGLSNLKSLTLSKVGDWNDESKLPFREFSEELGQLTQLNSLHMNRMSVRSLPASVASLKKLESLAVNQCLLETTPVELWNLAKLQHLSLSGNQLSGIPNDIALPSLRSLNLSKNPLKTLPEELGHQPKLAVLDLSDNSLLCLPEIFNSIEEINMSLDDKLRLLDFDYQGADGTGLTDWTEEPFKFPDQHPLVEEMQQQFRELGHEEYLGAMTALSKKSLVFQQAEDEDYSLQGNTRFGGWPDLPENVEYPRYLDTDQDPHCEYTCEFIAQINCAEVACHQSYLPRTGMLYFFIDSFHELNATVLYSAAEPEKLSSGKNTKLTDEDFFDLYDVPYRGFKVEPSVKLSLPFFYASYVNSYLFEGEASSLKGADSFLEDIDEELGFRDHSELCEMNAYVFTQHENPELQAALKYKGHPKDWVVLLKVPSLGNFQWCDAGELFFVIHKSDLKKGDFSKIYCSLESS